AKTGVHGHDEKEIDRREMRSDRLERRRGIQSQADAATRGAECPESLRDIMFSFRFDMDGYRIRAGLEKARKIMIRMFDHQMDVERKLGVFADRRDDRGPERNVVHKMAIHDVEVQPVRARFFRAMDLGFEMRKIRRENGRSDE